MKWTVVVFGATGDLAQRKLLPALQALKDKFLIIGVAQENNYSGCQCLDYYYSLDITKEEQFYKLSEFVTQKEQEHSLAANRILYCAVPSILFIPLTESAVKSRLITPQSENKNYQYIVYEKPFGWDKLSAQEINQVIEKLLPEEQIYRVDHYLLKELVSSLVLLRFSNIIFEPLWNSNFIDQVQIIAQEKIDIENRGSYYDAYGLLKDVVQNHLLQLTALIGMERPASLEIKDLQAAKIALLKTVSIEDGIKGQYEGYRQEKNVKAHSTTETFAALRLKIAHNRWKNTPWYIVAGKCLREKVTKIRIVFKQLSHSFGTCLESCQPNILTITISSPQGFELVINTKKPYELYTLLPVKLAYQYLTTQLQASEYQLLFEQIISHDQSMQVSSSEIETCWDIIEKSKQLPLYNYSCHSFGPEAELQEFIEKYGIYKEGIE